MFLKSSSTCFLFLCVLSMLPGCSRPDHKEPQKISINYQCPSGDKSFEAFIGRFTEDKGFQDERILYPLVFRSGSYNGANPYGVSISLLSSGDIKNLGHSLIRSNAEMKRDHIEQKAEIESEYFVEFIQYLPDADSDTVLYKFTNLNGCWYLEEAHDDSL